MKRRTPQPTVTAVFHGKSVELPAEAAAEFKASMEAWMQWVLADLGLPSETPPEAAILPFKKPRR